MARKKIEENNVIEEKGSNYVPKKTNKGLVAALIVCAVLVVLFTVVLPIAFAAFVLFFSISQTEFTKIDDNTIYVDNAGIEVTVEDSRYVEEDNCYVLYTRTELKDADKYKKSNFISDTFDVTYSFIDEDGYVVGSESLFIGNLDSHDKWRQTVSACGDYAKNIKSYEVESVDIY